MNASLLRGRLQVRILPGSPSLLKHSYRRPGGQVVYDDIQE